MNRRLPGTGHHAIAPTLLHEDTYASANANGYGYALTIETWFTPQESSTPEEKPYRQLRILTWEDRRITIRRDYRTPLEACEDFRNTVSQIDCLDPRLANFMHRYLNAWIAHPITWNRFCLLYTSPSPRD